MDFATLLGILGGMGLIIGSMALGGPLIAFFNVPGLMIVVGGTFAATLVNERMGHVVAAVRVILKAFFEARLVPDETILRVIALSAKARKEGLISLEGETIGDPYLSRGVQLGVDGLSPEVIQSILESELETMQKRHQRFQSIFRFMGSTAPAMGMVGTLIGLVQMLRTLDDPESIGPAMAIALLTTLYGAVLAFLLFNPLASKLEKRTRDEVAQGRLAIAGVESILKGDSSMVIQSKLDAYLSPLEREAMKSKK